MPSTDIPKEAVEKGSNHSCNGSCFPTTMRETLIKRIYTEFANPLRDGFFSVLSIIAWLAFSNVAYPATNRVTSLADAGPGSLREAIGSSANGDTVMFAVTGPITLTSGEIAVTKDLVVVGPTESNVTISGTESTRAFRVNTFISLKMTNITITDCRADKGAAIYNTGGDIFLVNCTLLIIEQLGNLRTAIRADPEQMVTEERYIIRG